MTVTSEIESESEQEQEPNPNEKPKLELKSETKEYIHYLPTLPKLLYFDKFSLKDSKL